MQELSITFISRYTYQDIILQSAIPYLDLENLKGRKISFLCGDAGPLALATIISYRLGSKKNDLPDYKILAHR